MADKPAKISTGGVKKGRNEGEKAVTANRLSDGITVYLYEDGSWHDSLRGAAVFEGDDALAALEQATVEETIVVGPYLMDVVQDGETVVPAGRALLRETIRSAGPTIKSDYSRTEVQ
ncbi:DUF2849 domain-containing protein [Aquisalinus flavus]|uniref:DUF2849 domain-containing protein n=1 Tax=Aquisalinus flavus TaxID=1526572 RepID=A0A8J2V3V6_9PROT|nr:DUF2849 domain-containing protein [Aquisalinus flavus]MBD0425394.1 DUF2849 domain-containing protein [Aquisalinus flavus]UNE48959.1 DUF2849 domain-containing protein [Aquisalinus flavus]GGD16416.1 hypothetical protein GCM10011342_26490 [Aquisalinus flavus]